MEAYAEAIDRVALAMLEAAHLAGGVDAIGRVIQDTQDRMNRAGKAIESMPDVERAVLTMGFIDAKAAP